MAKKDSPREKDFKRLMNCHKSALVEELLLDRARLAEVRRSLNEKTGELTTVLRDTTRDIEVLREQSEDWKARAVSFEEAIINLSLRVIEADAARDLERKAHNERLAADHIVLELANRHRFADVNGMGPTRMDFGLNQSGNWESR